MKLAKVFVVLAGFVLLLGVDAFAQVEPNLTPGTIELSQTVGFRYDKQSPDEGELDITNTTINFRPSIGYFINNKIEIEGDIIFSASKYETEHNGVSTSSSENTFGLIARGMYNIVGSSPMVPFVFVGAGMLMNSNDSDVEGTEETSMVLPEAGAGIKYFMGDKVAVRGELIFRRVSNPGGTKDWTATDIGLAVGLTMFLGQK
jgi:hypothetical protein